MKWDNNDSPVIAGYRVHYRHILETSEKVIDVGKNHSAVLRNLTPESRYSCSVRAYDAENFESEPSNEITFVTDLSAPTFASSSAGLGMRISGRPGRNVEVYGSSDLVHWTLLTTVVNVTGTLDLVGLADYMPPPAPAFFRVEPRGESFQGWMAGRGFSDPLADDDHDGISNVDAFTSGADLFAVPREALPSIKIVRRHTGGAYRKHVCFTYTYREDNGDFSAIAESSTDLRTWQEASLHTVVESSTLNGNGTRTVRLRESAPVDSDPINRRVYRVRYLPLGQTFLPWMQFNQASDPLGDPDGDGLDNFTTYASGADLQPGSVETRTRMGTAQITVGGRTSLFATLTYSLREGAVGVSTAIDSTPDLTGWSDAGHEFTEISSELRASGIRVITLRSIAPLRPHLLPRHFYRVRMQSAEPWAIATPYVPGFRP